MFPDSYSGFVLWLLVILHILGYVILLISKLEKKSADNILKLFFIFYKKIGFDISCKLSSPEMTICMKCQILFSVRR